MNPPAAYLLFAAATCAASDWIAVARHWKAEYLFKPLTMVLLIDVALALHPSDRTQRAWFVVALLFGLSGDIFLMLPADRFIPGLSSFLLGHLAYIAGLMRESERPATFTIVAIAVVALALVPQIRRIFSSVGTTHRPMLLPVTAYGLTIILMAAAAARSGDPWAIAGALLFMTSDTLIARERFVTTSQRFGVVITITYHLAQTALVLSLLG